MQSALVDGGVPAENIYFRANATSETVFRRGAIKQGDNLAVRYASGNRDEDAFLNRRTFGVSRDPNGHISFGYGLHFCLASSLARAITRVFLEESLPFFQDLQLDEGVIHTRSAWMSRIWSLPVERLPA